MKRFISAVDKGIRQFRSFAEAINRPDFTSFINGRGVAIEFERKAIQNIVLILVAAPVWDGDSENPASIRWGKTCLCERDSPMPIHLFNLDQFWILTTLADTIADFLLLLECRWALHASSLIPTDTDPVDEWFLVTFEQQKILEALTTKMPLEANGLQNVHANSLKILEMNEQSSYLIDVIIDGLSGCMESKVPIHKSLSRFVKFLAEPNSLAANRLLVPLLARLNRAERQNLANTYYVRASRCVDEGREFSFGAVIIPKFEEGYVVVGSSLDFEQTQVIAYNIGRVFCRKFGKAKAVVIFGCDAATGELPVGVLLVDATNGQDDDLGLFETEDAFSDPVEIVY